VNLLVTGAAGFIGTNFVRYWTRHHPTDRVVALDALTYAGNPVNLDDVRHRIHFVRADIGDLSTVEALLRDHRVDVVVNFAAESHNSLAVLDPHRFFATNVVGTQQLLEACRRVGLARFHHVSTCEVYGDLDLDDPVTITNCANNYGPYQFPEKVVPLFTTRALNDEPLPVYASSTHRREWLHVDDHCAAIERVLLDGRDGATYNVGSGVEASVADLATRILDHLGKPHTLLHTVPDRPGHDRRYLLDATLLRTELDWTPTVDFDRGLADTVTWYADHPDWWRPLRTAIDENTWAATSAASRPSPG
jgi:dTDP-glucose 4,6-dehydratase